MKICKNCGQQIAGGVKFCPNCGVAIVRTTTDSHKQRWHMSENKVQKPSTCEWKNQPDTLILQDEDGYEYEFVTTNLNQVLEIRDSKTIVDY